MSKNSFLFKINLNSSIPKYQQLDNVVMNFDNKEVTPALSSRPSEKLLLIDWNIHSKLNNNYVFQDFGIAFYEALKEGETLLKKYKEIVFVYPTFTNHSKETITYFKKICINFNLKHKVITNSKEFIIEKSIAYISVSDRILGMFLEHCREKDLEPGKDVGFLSYSDTPMKKIIYKRISVITTNFNELAIKVAEFVSKYEPMQYYIPTNLIIRESL